jgi:hypothetical protein
MCELRRCRSESVQYTRAPEENKPPVTPLRMWEDNIKIDLKEGRCGLDPFGLGYGQRWDGVGRVLQLWVS